MWFVMIVGIILTAFTLSHLLENYSPERLQQAFEWVGLAALGLGGLGLLGLEPPAARETLPPAARVGWRRTIGNVLENRDARRFFFYLIVMLAAILGQDVLLEPFAGEAFGLSVRETTRITSIWGTCVLAALVVANLLERPLGKRRVAQSGAVGAAAGFLIIVVSGLLHAQTVFYAGVVLLGLATGLATVSNLSLMLDMTTQRVGLFIGAWGVADALARLVGTVLSGVLRDLIGQLTQNSVLGYASVFGIEAGFLLISLWMLHRIDVGRFRQQAEPVDWVERTSHMGETSP
jgi:BCD family chlorophyll transporter-like MFS transporter